MKLYDLIDKNLLEEMIEKQYINVQTHPEFGYRIYSYSKSCSLNGVWNEATELCRGLIVDADDNIIARPFRKFFNIEEIADKGVIPNELPERIFEKKDGSVRPMIVKFDEETLRPKNPDDPRTQARRETNKANNNLVVTEFLPESRSFQVQTIPLEKVLFVETI